MAEKINLISLGFITGILSGLLGVGGGIILVPMMVTYLGISQHIAQGTSLAVVIPTALTSSVIYGLHGNFDFTTAIELAIGSMLGASLGARWMKNIPDIRLKQFFGVLLIFVGIRMIL